MPGVLLYFFVCASELRNEPSLMDHTRQMGLVDAYTGLILWFLFLKVDSDRYPVKTYSDIAERIFGRWAAYPINILQSVRLIVNVGTLCLSNGQSLSQISKGKVSTMLWLRI